MTETYRCNFREETFWDFEQIKVLQVPSSPFNSDKDCLHSKDLSQGLFMSHPSICESVAKLCDSHEG